METVDDPAASRRGALRPASFHPGRRRRQPDSAGAVSSGTAGTGTPWRLPSGTGNLLAHPQPGGAPGRTDAALSLACTERAGAIDVVRAARPTADSDGPLTPALRRHGRHQPGRADHGGLTTTSEGLPRSGATFLAAVQNAAPDRSPPMHARRRQVRRAPGGDGAPGNDRHHHRRGAALPTGLRRTARWTSCSPTRPGRWTGHGWALRSLTRPGPGKELSTTSAPRADRPTGRSPSRLDGDTRRHDPLTDRRDRAASALVVRAEALGSTPATPSPRSVVFRTEIGRSPQRRQQPENATGFDGGMRTLLAARTAGEDEEEQR